MSDLKHKIKLAKYNGSKFIYKHSTLTDWSIYALFVAAAFIGSDAILTPLDEMGTENQTEVSTQIQNNITELEKRSDLSSVKYLKKHQDQVISPKLAFKNKFKDTVDLMYLNEKEKGLVISEEDFKNFNADLKDIAKLREKEGMINLDTSLLLDNKYQSGYLDECTLKENNTDIKTCAIDKSHPDHALSMIFRISMLFTGVAFGTSGLTTRRNSKKWEKRNPPKKPSKWVI